MQVTRFVGASLHIDAKGRLTITRIGVSHAVRKTRDQQKLDKVRLSDYL